MEISNILTADILDIIFEGRNKEYGAYELRRTYGKRLLMSITVMFLLMGLLYGGMVLANKTGKEEMARVIVIPETTLENIVEKEKEIEPPPPPKQQEPPKMEMKKLVDQFKIVPDDVPADVIPPVDELEDVKIGNINREGLKDDGIVAPPSSDAVGTGVVELPKKHDEDDNTVFIKVEQESEYPGGFSAWKRYLERNLRYPQDAMDNNIAGTVTVQFIVDKEGNVSEVTVLSGPEELRAESIRVIKKSGKWAPAIQNGRKVKSYKKQPVSFVMPQE